MKKFKECSDLMTIQEMCQCLGDSISAQTLRKACIDGSIPATRIGRRWFIPRDKFLEQVNGGDAKNE